MRKDDIWGGASTASAILRVTSTFRRSRCAQSPCFRVCFWTVDQLAVTRLCKQVHYLPFRASCERADHAEQLFSAPLLLLS